MSYEGPPVAEPAAGAPVTGDDTVAPVVRRRHATAAPAGRGRKRVVRRRTTGWWAAATVLSVVALAALGWVGWRASLRITGGTPAVTDPSAPNYVAEVEPTPVELVAVQDATGELGAVLVVIAEPDGSGGTVVPVSSQLFVPASATAPQLELDKIYAEGGRESLRSRLGEAIGFGFTAATEATAEDLTQVAEVAGPVSLDNFENLSPAPALTDPVVPPEQVEIVYRSGPITLGPEEFGPYLTIRGRGESVDNRAIRQQQAWDALVVALAGKDVGSTGGSLGPLLADVLAGEVRFEQLPTTTLPQPDSIFTITVPDPSVLPSFTARLIAAPVSAFPGQRARTRILNGTTDPAATGPVGPKVVEAGGLVASVGNAASFDQTVTLVEWVSEAARPAAEAIAAELGVTAGPSAVAPTGADVIVTVGSGSTG